MPIISSQQEQFCTPRRAQKCLFASGNNSCKRNVSQDSDYSKDVEASSGEESDLGPMSPLALTDRSPSSCDSSPVGIQHTRITKRWTMTAFNLLSDNNSPKSPPSSLDKSTTEPSTPDRWSSTMKEIIPETPQRTFATEIQNQSITETPRKSGSSGYRLITPLGSTTKLALLPKLHRRKSLSTIETDENLSPEQKENTLKRHARDQLANLNPAKLFKADDACAPKARAALFQERRNEFNLKDFSLSTKTFYSGCEKYRSELPFVINSIRNSDVKKRHSLPKQSSSSSYRRSLKRQRFGGINAGVFHGIKKPKPKVKSETLKKEGQQVTRNLAVPNKNSFMEEQAQPVEATMIVERASSPKIDETKRFFKTIRQDQSATVTVNNKIKLKIADGKIVLNQNRKRVSFAKNMRIQQAKAEDVSYDATDLTVDEPEIEATLQQDKVANILKILENDWADDDYDTMETLIVCTNTVSPLKSTVLPQDGIFSPATELSNMTSTMNIKDTTSITDFGNLSLNNTDNNNGITEIGKESKEEYFPLFTKGYSAPNNIFEETNIKSTKAVKRNMQWQLSRKGGAGEDQYQLDAGQKRFGATQCPECNIVYQLGDPEDENNHLNYHNSIRILKFQGWKNERVIMEDSFTSSRIILVEPHDSKQYWKKVSEILNVVDRDLGLADMKISDYQSKKIFLYIREKNVLGVLVAEHIKTAYRMIPELIELDCCTAEGTPTKCGINVVWTTMSHRRQGIATKLVNTLRAKFFYGYVMSLDDIAFSTPSPSGKIFAEKYTKTRNFKVYN